MITLKRLSSAQVRQMFLDFFQEKNHAVEPSAPLVPVDDPTLLWINSGVATLKKYFDGRVVPANPRIVNAQKSIRTNDIDNVGKTARHHTFFEMLGNFSIGDYFKKESIHWAWEFLTHERWIGFDPLKLAVTIHPDDDEAFDIWHKEIGLPKERIIRLKENFWDIGEGPSGPNTEIFYDRGPSFGDDGNDPELYPGGENERHLEVWNLVFSQFNHNPDGTYTPLPKKNIDTGLGLERLVSILQDAPTNFDTDLFRPIIEHTVQLAGHPYGKTQAYDVAYKVIADHIRTVSFAIGDGALPSNDGRGYVLRRLLRRAVRYGKVLGIHEPFLYQLTPIVAKIMHDFYPEIEQKQTFIAQVIQTEEERFHETLTDGLNILGQFIQELKDQDKSVLPGSQAFMLYDTYGFPLDLTMDYAQEHDVDVNESEFDEHMQAQRDRARAARGNIGSMQIQGGALADLDVSSEFVGYEQENSESEIVALIMDAQHVDFVSEGQACQIILDRTPFYAESGGQVADRGQMTDGSIGSAGTTRSTGSKGSKGSKGSMTFDVDHVFKAPNGQHVHSGRLTTGTLRMGDKVMTSIESDSRNAIVKNHTATHLLHQALKDVLGDHVHQAGSLVSEERLRFDFAHFHAMTDEQFEEVEAIVNRYVWANLSVETTLRSLQQAKEMGAMALFGEKYGETVRVVQVGDYSLELCGGCHVHNTAEIGLFKLVSESGIGAGTRRVEALTGRRAYEYFNERTLTLMQVAQLVKSSIEEVPSRVQNLFSRIKELERENESLKSKLGNIEAHGLMDQVQDIEGVPLLAAKVSASGMDDLRQMVDELKQQMSSAVIVLGAVDEGKVLIVAGVTKDLLARGVHAGNIVKEVATRCGGGGGGRPDMAQAGGKTPEQLDDALKSTADFIKAVLHS